MFCLQRLIGRPALVRVLPVLGMQFKGSHRVCYVRLLIFSVLVLPVTNANVFAQGRSMTSTTISISSAGIPMSTVAFRKCGHTYSHGERNCRTCNSWAGQFL
jgi:hypothetical protein